jgi:hypothetical protein
MRRFWETVGQAFVDSNFRRSRVLAGQPEDNQEKALAADHDIAAIHDRINRTPGRHSLSRFEVGEVRRVFRIQVAVDLAVKICKQWHEFCTGREKPTYAGTSPEFNSALGLCASDTSWVRRITAPSANDAIENVHFDFAPEEWSCLVDFLRYTGTSSQTTAKLLEDFEANAWRSDCATSVTLRRTYTHPYPNW